MRTLSWNLVKMGGKMMFAASIAECRHMPELADFIWLRYWSPENIERYFRRYP